MVTARRLSTGGCIDRSQPLTFRFDGRQFAGFVGDTVASALLAAGVRLVGRSFRLHRPRGILSCGLEEPNALVHVRIGRFEEPNVRATLMRLRPGLEVFSQNAWPTLRWDVGELADALPKMIAAGFDHKAFIWPSWSWYEPLIRRVAGLGRIRSHDALAGTVAQSDFETDVLVCGGGIAGVAAAMAAGRSGAAVTLVHGGESVGDAFGSGDHQREGSGAPGVIRVLLNTMALGVFGEKVVLALQELGWGPEGPRRRLLRIRARAIVTATGAIEQPLVFENNDRPGVMLAGAVTEYLRRFAVCAGHTVVLVTNNDASYHDLLEWRAAGITTIAIIDSRTSPSAAAEAAAKFVGARIIRTPRSLAVQGRLAVRGINCRDAEGRVWTLPCDVVAMSGGYMPAVNLYSQSGGDLAYHAGQRCYIPSYSTHNVYAVGSASGVFDPESARTQAREVGEIAGVACAATVASAKGGRWNLRPNEPTKDTLLSLGPTRFEGRAHRQWLDYQHDVTVSDAAAAVDQGFTQVEHFKRFTTAGMAADQGKTGLRNSLEQLARFSNDACEDLRPPTFRPPFVPLPLLAAAGPNTGLWHHPQRRLPCHAAHVTQQAYFDDVGGWRRPMYYAQGGPRAACVEQEIRAVRTTAGLFEASPLGKIEVSGPDALLFLNRIYVNNLSSLESGQIRYVMMLRENGTVMDDGTVTRLGSDEFLITTTSGNAERVYLWMQEWAECEWPELKVIVTAVTTAWGTITLSGPRARTILQRAGANVDLTSTAFPHMRMRTGEVAGLPVRIARVSFTGELSFEINVASGHAPIVWKALSEAGRLLGLRPYGIEAMDVLRIEKGYFHIGAESDATTTPLDLGWGAVISRKSGDFIGRGALSLPAYQRADRLQLVGIIARDPTVRFTTGAHLVRDEHRRSEGYVTSASFSPTLGYTVGLAKLKGGRTRGGEQLLTYDEGEMTAVRIVDPVFYDTNHSRLQG
jgi:sarcosine oxidase, subunit alpha